MTYNTSDPYERKRFLTKAEKLAEKGALVELTEKSVRTVRQNSYLHLLIGIVAMEAGTTMEDAKESYFKRCANPRIFIRVDRDKILGMDREYLRSTRDLQKWEMSDAIDNFKRWASEQGIYLPDPDETEVIASATSKMEQLKNYL